MVRASTKHRSGITCLVGLSAPVTGASLEDECSWPPVIRRSCTRHAARVILPWSAIWAPCDNTRTPEPLARVTALRARTAARWPR
jgi:hypothetical protein